MTSPFPFPDWVPWWVHLAALLAVLFFVVLYLFLPFSVFGVKSRLEAIDARLDEIQGEIRSLTLRLPEMVAADEEDDHAPARPGQRPPIPPAAIPPSPGAAGRVASGRRERTEPRLW